MFEIIIALILILPILLMIEVGARIYQWLQGRFYVLKLEAADPADKNHTVAKTLLTIVRGIGLGLLFTLIILTLIAIFVG